MVPTPSEDNLRYFQNPSFDLTFDFSGIFISPSDFRFIRRVNSMDNGARESSFAEMLKLCSTRTFPEGLGFGRTRSKSWTKDVLEVCLLAFEIVLQLYLCGLDRANAHPKHDRLFRDVAKIWLCECFRKWTFPTHPEKEEVRLITHAFKFAWESFGKPNIPNWFSIVRDSYVALDCECYGVIFSRFDS